MRKSISVIVPIYNVKDYLRQCCDSILSQSFSDFELILINDGSTDGSYQIAQDIAREDDRILLINQANAGLSAARNAGLIKAKGLYVIFVDSDDWLEKDCLKLLYKNAESMLADVVCCRGQYINSLGKCKKSKRLVFNSYIEGDEILLDALKVKSFPTSACGKLYRADFLRANQLFFQQGIVNEDTLFSLQVACVARRVSFINDILFDIREREGSISRSSFERLFQDMDTALNLAREFMKQKDRYTNVIDKMFKMRYLKSTLYNLLQIAQRQDYMNYSKTYMYCMLHTSYRMYWKSCVYLPFRHKVMFILSLYPMSLFLSVRLLNCFGFRMH